MQPVLKLATIVSMPFQENTFIAHLEGRKDCLIVDPGFEPDRILEHLLQHDLAPAAILNTHGHSDHIAGNATIKRQWPACPIVIGIAEAAKLIDPKLNLSAAFGAALTSPPADVTVEDGQIYAVAGFDLEVRAIPGHSVGHVIYLWRQRQPAVAFVGDVIFAGSIGRTDFPDGNFDALAEGIRRKIFSLPNDTQLYSGHGPVTTVGEERRYNPFVGEQGEAV
ncbi:MAG: MBL fold metallo-hydrolase [Rhodopirellula sp.]|nr:MBL fold metallo-hydrolase [Rhodopirellula sp.]